MPTEVAKGQRRKTAIQRIHVAVSNITKASIPLELPMRSQYGSDMLLIFQLEALAQYLEDNQQAIKPPETNLEIAEKWAKAQELAKSNATKADILAVLLDKESE